MDDPRLNANPADLPVEAVTPPSKPPRHTRRLFDKILVAFHHACDEADFSVAERLLPILELMTVRRQRGDDSSRRRSIEGLVAAHERLWHLRHPTVR